MSYQYENKYDYEEGGDEGHGGEYAPETWDGNVGKGETRRNPGHSAPFKKQ